MNTLRVLWRNKNYRRTIKKIPKQVLCKGIYLTVICIPTCTHTAVIGTTESSLCIYYTFKIKLTSREPLEHRIMQLVPLFIGQVSGCDYKEYYVMYILPP